MTECIECKIKCVKMGKHVTRHGIRQRYKCPSCGRTYLDENYDMLFDIKRD